MDIMEVILIILVVGCVLFAFVNMIEVEVVHVEEIRQISDLTFAVSNTKYESFLIENENNIERVVPFNMGHGNIKGYYVTLIENKDLTI